MRFSAFLAMDIWMIIKNEFYVESAIVGGRRMFCFGYGEEAECVIRRVSDDSVVDVKLDESVFGVAEGDGRKMIVRPVRREYMELYRKIRSVEILEPSMGVVVVRVSGYGCSQDGLLVQLYGAGSWEDGYTVGAKLVHHKNLEFIGDRPTYCGILPNRQQVRFVYDFGMCRADVEAMFMEMRAQFG